MNSSIDARHPAEAMSAFGRGLSKHQMSILSKLPKDGSQVLLRKRDVSMLDLAAFTAITGDEFAMFTNGGVRFVIRGNKKRVPIYLRDAQKLNSDGFRWSGHTHPGLGKTSLIASEGDRMILKEFDQTQSVVFNSIGDYARFGKGW